MTTFNLCYCFILFIITCFSYCCCMMITTSPTGKINKINDINNGTVEVFFYNKSVLTHEFVELLCEVKPKTDATVLWMKGNEAISENQRVSFGNHTLIINQTTETDAGYYTCIVKTTFGTQNKTAYLTVTEDEELEEQVMRDDFSGDGEKCGSPLKRLISPCGTSYYPFCKSFVPPVNVYDIEITPKLDNKCSLISMTVQWKLPKEGNSDIWGWQIFLVDVGSYPGSSECVQLNRRYLWGSKDGDLYANYTFNQTRLETKFEITIQSLPGMSKQANMVAKTQSTKIEDLNCKVSSALDDCSYKATDVVVEQVNEDSVKLSWPDLVNSTINQELLSDFVILYNSTYKNNPCQKRTFLANIKDALKQSHILVYDLLPECQNYSFQITTVFNHNGCTKCNHICDNLSKKGNSSKFYFFPMKVSAAAVNHFNMQTNVLKAVVVVAVVFSLTVLLAVIIIICKKKRALEKTNETDIISDERPVTEVFVVHGSHCKDCEDAVLSVVTYLNLTGLCKCSIDLRSLPREWSRGMTQYYENKIAECQKVIIMFTVNKNCECEDNVKAKNFIYQKDLIHSELLANRSATKFIPVYMDFLFHLDIPSYLRNKKSFSLPTQLTELVLHIIGEPLCQPVSVCPMLSLEEDSSLMKHKKIMEAKIKDLNGKHQKKFKTKNNNMLAKIV